MQQQECYAAGGGGGVLEENRTIPELEDDKEEKNKKWEQVVWRVSFISSVRVRPSQKGWVAQLDADKEKCGRYCCCWAERGRTKKHDNNMGYLSGGVQDSSW